MRWLALPLLHFGVFVSDNYQFNCYLIILLYFIQMGICWEFWMSWLTKKEKSKSLYTQIFFFPLFCSLCGYCVDAHVRSSEANWGGVPQVTLSTPNGPHCLPPLFLLHPGHGQEGQVWQFFVQTFWGIFQTFLFWYRMSVWILSKCCSPEVWKMKMVPTVYFLILGVIFFHLKTPRRQKTCNISRDLKQYEWMERISVEELMVKGYITIRKQCKISPKWSGG